MASKTVVIGARWTRAPGRRFHGRSRRARSGSRAFCVTHPGHAGSYGYVAKDAHVCQVWGVDYLKYDLCRFRSIMRKCAPHDRDVQMRMMRGASAKMHKALHGAQQAMDL